MILKNIIKGKKSGTTSLLSGDRVVVHDEKLASRLEGKSFGEVKGKKLFLNLYEACLLVEDGKLEVFEGKKKLKLKELMEVGENLNEGFAMKYDVFNDLRIGKGLIVKSGIKFGCDFVVYARGKKPGNGHSKWMVHVMPEGSRIDYSEITRAARLATNVKKSMLFASVTERGPVYYEISRAKL